VEVYWPASDGRQRFADVGKNRWLRIEEFADRPAPLERRSVRLGGDRRGP
jgi:hypothetical protein